MAKRAFDLTLATLGLLVLSPLLVVVAVCNRALLGSPVCFVQRRPGRGGALFPLIKFRTMRDAVGPDGAPLPDDQRLTRWGRFLRATSIDELPELINVVRGEMSLVGPRPLLADYLPLYSKEQARRHDVRPGITGWAQVRGRNALSWDDKFALDLWYVDNRTLWLDLWILWLTVWAVVRRDGISASGHATMPRFEGNAPASGEESSAP